MSSILLFGRDARLLGERIRERYGAHVAVAWDVVSARKLAQTRSDWSGFVVDAPSGTTPDGVALVEEIRRGGQGGVVLMIARQCSARLCERAGPLGLRVTSAPVAAAVLRRFLDEVVAYDMRRVRTCGELAALWPGFESLSNRSRELLLRFVECEDGDRVRQAMGLAGSTYRAYVRNIVRTFGVRSMEAVVSELQRERYARAAAARRALRKPDPVRVRTERTSTVHEKPPSPAGRRKVG